MINTIVIICISVLYLIAQISIIMILNNRTAQNSINENFKDKVELYIEFIKRSLEQRISYEVNTINGNAISTGIQRELSNEERLEIYQKVTTELISDMSISMRNFLYDEFGEKLIQNYIRMISFELLFKYTI